MENASKALIIAGAILLSILLISIGIFVFNSSKGTTEQAGIAGKLMETKAADAPDIIEGYTVNRYADETSQVSNYYFEDYFTGIKLDENMTYVISFDYTIEKMKKTQDNDKIGCGIGIGENNPLDYTYDFAGSAQSEKQTFLIPYEKQNIGEKGTFTFILKPNEYNNFNNNKDKDLYLSLRLARTNFVSDTAVKIENIKIKYRAE